MRTIFAFCILLTMGSIPAWATLGGNVSSVDSDVQTLHGKRSVISKPGYNLHQITLQDNSVVNEFVTPDGVVFGVSWQGHVMPDLHQILGIYMADLQQGVRTNVVRRRSVTIQGSDLVFSNAGHLRFFRGRAYVPSLVPTTLAPEVVQ